MFNLAIIIGSGYLAYQSQIQQRDEAELARLDPESHKLRNTYAIQRMNAPLKRKLAGTSEPRLLKRNVTGRINDTVEHRRATANLIFNSEVPIDYVKEYSFGSQDVDQSVTAKMRLWKGMAPKWLNSDKLEDYLVGPTRIGRGRVKRETYESVIKPRRRDIEPTVAWTS